MRAVLAGLVLLALGCATTSEAPEPAPEPPAPEPVAEEKPKAPEFTLESADVIREKLAAGAVLVDVRPANRYEEGHLEGVPNVPWKEFEGRMSELEGWTGGDKSKPIVVYCGNGSMAAKIRDTLKAQGYADVSAQSQKVVKEVRAASEAPADAPAE